MGFLEHQSNKISIISTDDILKREDNEEKTKTTEIR